MDEVRTLSQLMNALQRGCTVSDGKIVYPPHIEPLLKPRQGPRKMERLFCVSVADHFIGIQSSYSEIYDLCRDYLSDHEPEVLIQASESDLEFERREMKKEHISHENGALEMFALHRKMSECMLRFDTFLMHGAVVACGNDAFLFTAESGTGKTTHIRKWTENRKDVRIVNGDKPYIRVTEDSAIACGSPWRGKENYGENMMVPLRAIVLMERGENNSMEEIPFEEAFPFLLHQTYMPPETALKKKTLILLSMMREKVRFYRFIFNNMKDDAFSVAYQTLTEEKDEEND